MLAGRVTGRYFYFILIVYLFGKKRKGRFHVIWREDKQTIFPISRENFECMGLGKKKKNEKMKEIKVQ